MPATFTQSRRLQPRPSNLTESSHSLQRRIAQFLAERRFPGVSVSVDDRSVTLGGHVSSTYERQMLALSIARLVGEREVINKIEMADEPPALSSRVISIQEIAGATVDVLAAIPRGAYALLVGLILIPAVWGATAERPVDSQVRVYPTTGKLLVNGQPASGALLVLHPQDQKFPTGIVATATVSPDGTFSVGTYSRNDGAPAGEYVATVLWNRMVDGQAGRNVLPASYTSVGTSPVKFTVRKTRQNPLDPIEIAITERRTR